MLELNRLIQRIGRGIANVKKQVGSKALAKFHGCGGNSGLPWREKQVPLWCMGVPGTTTGLFLALYQNGEGTIYLWLTHGAH